MDLHSRMDLDGVALVTSEIGYARPRITSRSCSRHEKERDM